MAQLWLDAFTAKPHIILHYGKLVVFEYYSIIQTDLNEHQPAYEESAFAHFQISNKYRSCGSGQVIYHWRYCFVCATHYQTNQTMEWQVATMDLYIFLSHRYLGNRHEIWSTNKSNHLISSYFCSVSMYRCESRGREWEMGDGERFRHILKTNICASKKTRFCIYNIHASDSKIYSI